MSGNAIVQANGGRPLKPKERLRAMLVRANDNFAAVLPSGVTPERFRQVVIAATSRNEKLLNCDPRALLNEAMRCATDGLVPDGSEAALVPYKSDVTYIPMVRGLCKLALQSGIVTGLVVDLVHEGDVFDVWTNEKGAHLTHRPNLTDPDREDKPVLHAYAIATIKGGGSYVERMSRKQLDGIRRMSKATRDDSPWNRHTGEMQKKTVLRRLFKRLPVAIAPMWMDDRDPDPIEPSGPVLAIDNDAGAPEADATEPKVDALDAFADGAPDDGVVDVQAEPLEDDTLARASKAAERGSAAFDAFLNGLSDGEAGELRAHLPSLNAMAGRADRELQ